MTTLGCEERVEIAQAGHLLPSDRPVEQRQGPTVARIMLGTQLRRLRQARGLTAEQQDTRSARRTVGGPLTILRFAEPEIPDIAHVQHQTTALYLDRDEDVQPYRTLMDHLCVLAVSPAKTINYLSTILAHP